MVLPILGRLSNDESTYITFSKALLDYDEACTNGTEYYFSKVVALNLPVWKKDSSDSYFYKDLAETPLAEKNDNPNVVVPKMIQHYMENILRQPLDALYDDVDKPVQEITEIAFYKTLNAMGMSKESIQENITFCNDIVTSNFTKIENNNGWGEIICQIPNKCRKFTPKFKEISNLKNFVVTNDSTNFGDITGEQIPFYDKDLKYNGYDMNGWNFALDIPNSSYDSEIKSEFDFNVLLLFYRDKSGVDKLHGINFIFPWENDTAKASWTQTTFTQKTNIVRSIGYQFIFNLKTCNNEASKTKVYEQYESIMWWNGFDKTLSGLNSFLEYKMKEQGYIDGTIQHIFGD